MRASILAVLLTTLIASGSLPSIGRAQNSPKSLDGLDRQITKMLADWQVPGVAISIVRRDTVLLARGYGLREIGKPGLVDADTRFSIGSCSKAFTSAAIAGLVGASKMRYDDPVTDWLPWFQTPDPWVTREIRVRDLLAHRSGYDLFDEAKIWQFATSAKDLVVRTTLEPSRSRFRERYRYSNSMFSAAGLVVEAVSATSYDEYVQREIFTPLGMRRTITSSRDQVAGDNYALGHMMNGAAIVPEPRDFIDDTTLVATGGVISTAADMAQWLRFQLGKGRMGKTRLVDSAAFAEQHIPHTPARGGPVEAAYWFAHVDAADLQTRHWNYALGWFVVDYRGRNLVWHGGTFNGYRCAIGFLPDEQVGVYIGVNRMTLLPPALMFDLLDRLTGGERRDWNAIFLREARLQAEDAGRAATLAARRNTGTKPSWPLAADTGSYSQAAIGTLRIALDGDRLSAVVGRFTARLEHWQYDSFRATWDAALPAGIVTFAYDDSGKARSVTVEGLGVFNRDR